MRPALSKVLALITRAKKNVSVPVLIGAFFFLLAVYCHQKHYDGPTPASRLSLLYCLCAHGTLEISGSIRSTPDKAVVDGRYYSDKAPGMAAAAAPGFALTWFG